MCLVTQSWRDRTSNAHYQHMCRVQIKASFPRHWIIHCHSNNRVSLTEAKICCDQISKFLLTPTAFWGSHFKPLELPVKIKNPGSAGCWPEIHPGSATLGAGVFMLRWFITSLVTPQSHLTCCSSSSLTPPQLTGRLVNPSALPSVRSCVSQTTCQCFPPLPNLQENSLSP